MNEIIVSINDENIKNLFLTIKKYKLSIPKTKQYVDSVFISDVKILLLKLEKDCKNSVKFPKLEIKKQMRYKKRSITGMDETNLSESIAITNANISGETIKINSENILRSKLNLYKEKKIDIKITKNARREC